MSDVPQGSGWWQAADLKWYPPELHADYLAAPLQDEQPQEPPPGQPLGGRPGPGWWQAADLKWYPPEQHADHEEPTPPEEQPQQPGDLHLAATQQHPGAPVPSTDPLTGRHPTSATRHSPGGRTERPS